jgi:hypothetical protein
MERLLPTLNLLSLVCSFSSTTLPAFDTLWPGATSSSSAFPPLIGRTRLSFWFSLRTPRSTIYAPHSTLNFAVTNHNTEQHRLYSCRMEYYTGNYKYLPLRRGTRILYKPDGTFPPPNVPPDAVCLTASTAKYLMETTGDIESWNFSLVPSATRCAVGCVLRQLNAIQHTMRFRTCGAIKQQRE